MSCLQAGRCEEGERSREEAGLAPWGSSHHSGFARRPNPQKRTEGTAFTQFPGRKLQPVKTCHGQEQKGVPWWLFAPVGHSTRRVSPKKKKKDINGRSPATGSLFIQHPIFPKVAKKPKTKIPSKNKPEFYFLFVWVMEEKLS